MGKKIKNSHSLKGSPFESGVDHVLDLRGMIIPLTLLKITQAFRNINAGETIDIFGSDPDTKKDFLKVLATTSCEVLHIKNEKDGYLIRLKKGTTRKEA
jgi:TusA-related sulfurtransferase